ncbi:MAG: PHP domain-containing protein [Vallitaleaceae bacterium]|nr:PHP domain-containing protein [Vallitaleaceae bacterium]
MKKMGKIDLHIHTAEVSPCGNVSASDLVKLYKERGYEGLVITDHYFKGYFDDLGEMPWEEKIQHYLEGYRKALEVGEGMDLSVFLGMEIRVESDPNDYLIYGFDQTFLINNPNLYDLDVQDLVNRVKENQLMIFQAHPFRRGMHQKFIHMLDGFECYNGNRRHNSRNQLAEELLESSQGIGLSGSDFHELEDLAYGGIVLPDRIRTIEQLMAGLKSKGYTYIKETKVL